MERIIRRSLPAVLATSLVAGALAVPAIAASDDGVTDTVEPTTVELTTVEPTAEAASTAAPDHAGGLGLHRLDVRLAQGLEPGELAERLAAELGLETAEVQAAIDAVKADLADEWLAAAVEDGRLTQEQADEAAAALAAGDTEALRALWQEVRLQLLEARLDERVEAGRLTHEEADALLERAEEGRFPFRDRGRPGPGLRGGFGR